MEGGGVKAESESALGPVLLPVGTDDCSICRFIAGKRTPMFVDCYRLCRACASDPEIMRRFQNRRQFFEFRCSAVISQCILLLIPLGLLFRQPEVENFTWLGPFSFVHSRFLSSFVILAYMVAMVLLERRWKRILRYDGDRKFREELFLWKVSR